MIKAGNSKLNCSNFNFITFTPFYSFNVIFDFCSLSVIGLTIFGIGLSVGFMALLAYHAKNVVYSLIYTIIGLLSLVVCVCLYFYATVTSDGGVLIVPLVISIAVLLIVVILFRILQKKIDVASEIISESSKYA